MVLFMSVPFSNVRCNFGDDILGDIRQVPRCRQVSDGDVDRYVDQPCHHSSDAFGNAANVGRIVNGNVYRTRVSVDDDAGDSASW